MTDRAALLELHEELQAILRATYRTITPIYGPLQQRLHAACVKLEGIIVRDSEASGEE